MKEKFKMMIRAKPYHMMKYKLAIWLYKIYNSTTINDDWLDLNFQQNFNNRNNFVQIFVNSRLWFGKNSILNRLNCLNGTIDYDWINQSLNSFKLKCKLKFYHNILDKNYQITMQVYFLNSKVIYNENK